MMQQQLATVIQYIQMESRTGLLLVKRGEEGSLEEGTILFHNGRMQEARTGRRSKFDAFKYLCTWERYEFVFRTPDGQTSLSYPLSTLENRALNSFSLPSTPIPSLLRPTPPEGEKKDRQGTIVVPSHSRYQSSDALQVIAKMGLTRAHRRLFLLINGERSIADLARLMTCSEDQVYQYLHELEKAAVIRIVEKVLGE